MLWQPLVAGRTLTLALACMFAAGCNGSGNPQVENSARKYSAPYFVDIIKDVKPAVVNIATERKIAVKTSDRLGPANKTVSLNSLGSGFIISADGYIVTNSHIIDKMDGITVRLYNREQYAAKVILRDDASDIAILRIETPQALPAAVLGDSSGLEVGEWVIAIGNPFGLEHTVTVGVVSASGRVIGAGPLADLIQTDASINPGNSGGPLINLRGQVIGINTALVRSEGGSAGIGFAIPAGKARSLMQKLDNRTP
ncbi:MAG: hypothetical protein BMS9Abin08_0534 [Gammaproteobacteria bacterium]|nr:MAG: hypothetical protein BMS9Abin08_0534 [Gammaproteobacteria bacterium]